MRRFPLILESGEIIEADIATIVALNFGFPENVVGGLVASVDTNVHALSDHASAGASAGEDLVAPIRLQLGASVAGSVTVLRQKDSGDAPLITDTDHFLTVLLARDFALFDEINMVDKLYYIFSVGSGSPEEFYWSAGF